MSFKICVEMRNIMIHKFKFNNKSLAHIAFSIRDKVFVQEQNVEPELEYDEFEDISNHYLLYYKEEPIATARWRETEKGIKLERFAMLKEYRNKGIGSELLKEVLKDVIPLRKRVYLHAQLNALSYYERFGFIRIGNIFMEADIEHYVMEYSS